MLKRLNEIFKHYGFKQQRLKYLEEVKELADLLNLAEHDIRVLEHDNKPVSSIQYRSEIISEIADVTVMLNHFKEFFEISEEEVRKEIEFKLNRQIKRIEEETL